MGDTGKTYDSVIATYYDRLLWFCPFTHAFCCP